jgi:hypothetical protein
MLVRRLWSYLANLSLGRLALWCYFIWYLVNLYFYFDPNRRLWLTSVGLSAIIGTALLINTTRSGRVPVKLETWPTFRLFVIPFCVSSFSALVVKRGFFLVFSPNQRVLLTGGILIASFCAFVAILKITRR